jgi:hypothetical protein
MLASSRGKIWKAYVSDSSVPDPADGGVHYFAGNYAISGSNGSEGAGSARCFGVKSKAVSQGPFVRLSCPDGLILNQVRGEAWHYRETAQ